MQRLNLPQQSISTSALEHMVEVEDSMRGTAETASSPSPPSTRQHLGPRMALQLLLPQTHCFSRGKLLLGTLYWREAPFPAFLSRSCLQPFS